MSSGLASLISLAIYVMAVAGLSIVNVTNSFAHNLVPLSGGGGEGDVFRLAGVAYEPTFLAFYFITTLPVTLTILISRPGWLPRPLLITILLLQSTAMFLTFSSGGFSALAFAVILLAPLWFKYVLSRNAGRVAATVILCVLGLVGAISVAAPAIAHILAITVAKIFAGADNIRRDEWAVGYKLAQRYPVLGAGPGLAHYHFPEYHRLMTSQVFRIFNEVNNLYLNILAESGIVGFIAFVYLGVVGIAALVKILWRYGPRNVPVLTALCASLAGCAVQYMGMNTLFLIYFCGLLGITLAGARLAGTGVEQSATPERYFHGVREPKSAKT